MSNHLDGLSQQELAVLYATRESENCQSLVELTRNVEAPSTQIGEVGETVDSLVAKHILEEVHCFNGICYGYDQQSEIADLVYSAIYNVEPLGF